jgi:hypothetical protein
MVLLRKSIPQNHNLKTAAELGVMACMHTPNHISIVDRISYIVFSVLLFSYGTLGIKFNDLYIPGKHGRGIHLHDAPAWVMYGAMICACLVMLSVIVDHYDKRDNERLYEVFAKFFKYLGLVFFCTSFYIFSKFLGVFMAVFMAIGEIKEIPKVKTEIERIKGRLPTVVSARAKPRPLMQSIIMWVLIVVGLILFFFFGLLLLIRLTVP